MDEIKGLPELDQASGELLTQMLAGDRRAGARGVTLGGGRGRTVGAVAVDPSSPFSGGAVLGDRVRMQEHALDPGVFIRSLGSRGAHGGVSRATLEIACLLD